MSEGYSDWFDELYERVRREALRPLWDIAEGCLEPLVDVHELEKEIVITADLPCVQSKDDISIKAYEDSVELEASMDRGIIWENWGTVQRHLHFRTFKKRIRLRSKTDPKKAKASFKQGILTLRLPKVSRGVPVEVR
ncbi:MAG: Hsp20/alpha crystallin family protein [Thaumarchaeota archaeon]|nr:Hsp20/alpha crystallin family protein [Nitrososphaerota archaeon]